MIVVTGGAGFIGSNIVRALNARGRRDIVVVDNLERGEKVRNLADCVISDYLDRAEFLTVMARGDRLGGVEAVCHQGACSDTMEQDGRYMMENNYSYSRSVFNYCRGLRVPLVYASSASVYGNGACFREAGECEQPLNAYAFSKYAFDNHVRQRLSDAGIPVVGLRYFNVYGPREHHKGRMASVAFHMFNQYRDQGRVRLFSGCDGYADGEQKRDFVSVADCVAVNLHFLDHASTSGIFNLGTGRAQTFNEVACAVVNRMRMRRMQAALSLDELIESGAIEYIPFPDALKGRYQSFTEADLSALRAAGYEGNFAGVADGVGAYVDELAAGEPHE